VSALTVRPTASDRSEAEFDQSPELTSIPSRYPSSSRQDGALAKFVVREFEEYLRCGLLSAGCLPQLQLLCLEKTAFLALRGFLCLNCRAQESATMFWHFDSRHKYSAIVMMALIGCGEAKTGLFSNPSGLTGGAGLTGGSSSFGEARSGGGGSSATANGGLGGGGSGGTLSTGGTESGGEGPTGTPEGSSGGALGGTNSGGTNSGGTGGTTNPSSGGMGQAGSPGMGGTGPKVVLNEILGVGDLVEIYNAGDRVANISGYLVTDNTSTGTPDVANPFVFPANTLLQPGHFAVVIGMGDEDGAVNGGPFSGKMCGNVTVECYKGIFAVSQTDGENVFLLNPAQSVLDQVAYPADTSPSYGRLPSGVGSFAVTTETTFGFSNK